MQSASSYSGCHIGYAKGYLGFDQLSAGSNFQLSHPRAGTDSG
jgi:hypothetical protein